MPFITRANTTIHGAMTFTGNTLGLSKRSNENAIGTIHSIGAFVTLDTTLQVDEYPNGTTLDYPKNSSSAILNLPSNAIVSYAELIWSGTYKTASAFGNPGLSIPINALNNAVTFITPDNVPKLITPDLATRIENNSNEGVYYYVRSADVTQYVKQYAVGNNTYSAANIPGLCDPLESRSSTTCYCGWTLAVIYELASAPLRNMVLRVGQDIINSGDPNGTTISVANFVTPFEGTVNGRILISNGEGDSQLTGDSAYFATNTSSFDNAHRLSGINNPATNFFCSQINDDNGNLNTSGTFGNRNNTRNPDNSFTLTNGARQGWDITNVDASPMLTNNQTQAYLRITTSGDTYLPNAIGTQINIEELDLTITKSSPQANQNVAIGDIINYTLTINNTDTTLDGNNLQIVDALPTGLSLVPNSVSINGGAPQNIDITTLPGVQIASLPRGTSATVTFNAVVTGAPTTIDNTFTNQGTVNFSFTPAQGITFNDHLTSNPIVNNYYTDQTTLTKTVSPSGSVPPNTELTYTLTFKNNSASSIATVTLKDSVPAGTTIVAGSDACGVLSATGNTVTNLASGGTVTCTYKVLVNDATTGMVKNSATATYKYTGGGKEYTRSASVTTPIITPSITIQKTQSADNVVANDVVTYTLLLTNKSSIPLTNIIITDLLPTGLTYETGTFRVNGTLIPGTINLATGVTLTGYTLPTQNSTLTVTFNVRVTDINSAPFTNTASVKADYTPNTNIPVTITATSNPVTLYTAVPPLTVTKTADKTMIDADGTDTVTYTLTILSSSNASNFVLTEPLPVSGTTYMTYEPDDATNPSISPAVGTITKFPAQNNFTVEIDNILAGVPYTVTFIAKADALATGVPDRTFVNTATFEYDYAINPNKPADLTHVEGETQPPVYVTQTQHTFTFDKNIYLASDTNLTSPIDTAYNDENLVFQLLFQNDDQDDLEVTTLEDIVLPTSQFTVTSVELYDMNGAAKTLISPTLYDVTYPADNAANELIITFNPSPYTLLASHALELLINATTLSNVSLTTATDYGSLTYNVEGSSNFVTTPIKTLTIYTPEINIDKSSSETTVQDGEEFYYEMIVKNTGNITLKNVFVSDTTLAAYFTNNNLNLIGNILVDNVLDGTDVTNITLPDLVPNQSSVIRIPVSVINLPDFDEFINTANATGTATINRLEIPTTKEVTDADTHTLPIIRIDISLEKTASLSEAENGQTIRYTITVTNNSNRVLDHAYVQDILPDGIIVVKDSIVPPGNLELGIDVGPMDIGETQTITFDAIIDLDDTDIPPSIVDLENCVYVNYSYTDDDNIVTCGTTDTECVTTTVYTPAILVSKVTNDLSYQIGDTFDYVITVINTGNVAFSSLALSDRLPANLTQVGTTISVNNGTTTKQVTADLTSPAYVDLGETVLVGQTITITIPVKVTSFPANAGNDECFDNTASIRYQYSIGTSTVVHTKFSDSTTTVCIVNPNVTGVKQGSPSTVTDGDLIGYIVTLTNNGNVDVTNIQFVDPLPAGLEYAQDFTVVNGVIYPSTPTQGIPIALIPANGGFVTLLYTARVVDITKQSYVNQGTFTYDYIFNGNTITSPTQETNEVTITVPDATTGSMTIVKSSPDETVRANDLITYSLLVTNTGDTTLKDITITDTLPIGLTFVEGSVTVDGVSTTDNITTTGVPIDFLYTESSGEPYTAVITFRAQADDLVESTYTNVSNGTFTAITTNGDVSGSATSNELIQNGVFLNVEKTGDRDSTTAGDIINYTVTVTNESSVELFDVVIDDTIDDRTSVDVTNVRLNGTLVTGFPTIDVGTLAAFGTIGDTALLTFTATVDSDATGAPIINSAFASGTTSDNKTLQDIGLASTNLIPTVVTPNPVLTIEKSSNLSSIGICGTVLYTLTITNTGNTDLTNIIIRDILPDGMFIVPNTLTVNGRFYSGDITNGILLGTIAAGDAATSITFLAQTDGLKQFYTNQASATYNYVIDSSTLSGAALSNTLTLPTTWAYQTDINSISVKLPSRRNIVGICGVSMDIDSVDSYFELNQTFFKFSYTIYVDYTNSKGESGTFKQCGKNSFYIAGDAADMCMKAFTTFDFDPQCARLTVYPNVIIG